jgi:hypothetical protein
MATKEPNKIKDRYMHRFIFIDAENAEIGEVECREGETLEFMQKHVQGYIERAHTFNINGKECEVYVNEEGLINQLPYGVKIDESHQPLFFGNAIIVGYDEDGETVSVPDEITMEDISSRIQILQKRI